MLMPLLSTLETLNTHLPQNCKLVCYLHLWMGYVASFIFLLFFFMLLGFCEEDGSQVVAVVVFFGWRFVNENPFGDGHFERDGYY